MKTIVAAALPLLAALTIAACGERADETGDHDTTIVADTAPTPAPASMPAPGASSDTARARWSHGVLRPVDESQRDTSFATYLAMLRLAVRDRDVDAVIAAADSGIRLSFGGDGGHATFRQWLADPERGLWKTLDDVLSHGGAFREGSAYWAPYVYAKWPESFDSFRFAAIVDSGVPVRARPDMASEVIATLSHDIVEVVSSGSFEGKELTAIKSKDGRMGSVERRFVRSPVDYRAGFRKVNGRWVMDALVAGD